ncbi:putative uncharacterized protein [Firmicutes bacterium CAG:313]|nr:putative uncharacterized protein [Firmicutes bacterium CAG:313]
MKSEKKTIFNICTSGIFLALALVLPFFTGQIPSIGSMILPMHLPIIICGFVIGWPYGLVIGFCAPLLRHVMFGMPPIFPTGIAMSFELATYGFVSGIIYKLLQKTKMNNWLVMYLTLIIAMLIGRVIWGITMYFIALGNSNVSFGFKAFLSGAFIKAWPGILIQLLIVPPIVFAIEKVKNK